MKNHELKILPQYFEAVNSGRKNFEIRKNDRDYHVGDKLILKEFNGDYTGRECERFVSYIFSGFGLEEGYVVLSLELDFEDIKCQICDGLCKYSANWDPEDGDIFESEFCRNCVLDRL